MLPLPTFAFDQADKPGKTGGLRTSFLSILHAQVSEASRREDGPDWLLDLAPMD